MRPLLLLALALTAPIARAATGGTPITVSHSGFLIGPDDQPLDATPTLKFRVYTGLTAGTLEWEGTCAGVPVARGYYAVVLGDGACPGSGGAGDSVLDTSDLPGAPRWLEVVVGASTLAPRLTLTSAPVAARALDADTLDGLAPGAFAAAAHTHAAGTITGLATVATTGAWNDLLGKPATFPPATHGHAAGEITGLATVATTGSWNSLLDKPATFPPATHGHAATEITGLPSALAGATIPGTITVNGTIQATAGGIQFPDGTTQTTAGGAAGGGVDASTSLLLHFDNSLADASNGSVPLTNVGATFTTTRKFGTHAASFNGSTQYVTGPTGATTQFAADFTIDGWIYPTSYTASPDNSILETRAGCASAAGVELTLKGAAGNLSLYTAGAYAITGAAPGLNTWSHVALVRSGSTITLYLNGVAQGTQTNATNFSDGQIFIGRASCAVGNWFAGHIDELRVSKVARWVSNFTPPAAATGGNTWSSAGTDVYYSAGNVGIGTSAPTAPLHVWGSANGQFLVGASGKAQAIRTANVASLALSVENRNAPLAGLGPVLGFYGNTDGGSELASLWSGWNTTNTNDAYLAFSTRGSSTNTERMRITSSGNVGIGTTNPGATLDVGGRIHGRKFGKVVASLHNVGSGATTTFDLCYGDGGLLWVGGTSGGNVYQTSILYHYMAGSTQLTLVRASEGGNNLGAHNFTLTRVSGSSSGSSTCSSWYHRVQLQATGSFNDNIGDVVQLDTL